MILLCKLHCTFQDKYLLCKKKKKNACLSRLFKFIFQENSRNKNIPRPGQEHQLSQFMGRPPPGPLGSVMFVMNQQMLFIWKTSTKWQPRALETRPVQTG